jgi:TM2 domain-containing membrane protein YozV
MIFTLWSALKIIVRSISFCYCIVCPSVTPSLVFVAWYMWGSCCSMFKNWVTRTSHIPCNKDQRRGNRRTTERKRTNNDHQNTPQVIKHWATRTSHITVVKIIVRSFFFCCPSVTPSLVFVAWYMWGSCYSIFSYLWSVLIRKKKNEQWSSKHSTDN